MKQGVILVPLPAVQYGTQGTFVYVIDPTKNTVAMKDVKVGTIDSGMAEITGINSGDMVVTDGVDKLTEGSSVIVQKGGDLSAPPAGDGKTPSGSAHHKHKPQNQAAAAGSGSA